MKERRKDTLTPPSGKKRFMWYGPGLMWMISSVGSGSVLFTPRVGARYGYELLWVALIIIFLMWIMIKEVGRYSVATGKTLFDGFRDISGKTQWPIWLIFLPQVVAAVVTISGIAALVGSALMIAFPGNQAIYSVASIILSVILVVSGRYKVVESVASVMAGILVAVIIITAITVFPGPADLIQGVVPGIPADFEMRFVMPWLGFILAGAAGIMWFSYWVVAREYGGPQAADEDIISFEEGKHEPDPSVTAKLKDWLKIMNTTAAIGVVGGGLIIVSFLILGTELLKPQGIIPEGIRVAEDLTKLLSEVWGRIGFWFLIAGITIALAGTILSNQDGWGRMFADGTIILTNRFVGKENVEKKKGYFFHLIKNRSKLKNYYAVIFGAIIPLIVFFLVRNPVDILAIAGTVAAIHTPFVVFLTLYLNLKKLPSALQPSLFSIIGMILSGLFFTFFGVYHFITL